MLPFIWLLEFYHGRGSGRLATQQIDTDQTQRSSGFLEEARADDLVPRLKSGDHL